MSETAMHRPRQALLRMFAQPVLGPPSGTTLSLQTGRSGFFQGGTGWRSTLHGDRIHA
jgi:hypothetical protein